MAILHPFRALRPVPEKVQEIASVPYDVINTEEARQLAQGKPWSFLHVIRPEIDLPEGTDEHAPEVYEKGAENLRRFAESPYFLMEEEPSLYLYRLIMGDREQTGIFGTVAVQDYDQDVILKHEKTRPAKEEDRMKHILAQRAHAEPVMLTFKGRPDILEYMEEVKQQAPLYDFVAEDGVRHTIWRIPEPERLVEAFQRVDRLYVADGHHRCKAASRVAEVLRQEEGDNPEAEYNFFPAVIFPMEQMQILPYNRIIKQLPVPADVFLKQLKERFEVVEGALPLPQAPGEIAIYLDGKWYGVKLPPSRQDSVAAQLDVARLGEHILEPMLGITDPRRDPTIDFVGGIRGVQELERLVDTGQAAMAISMYPTQIEQLIAVSDAGELMPPKSTWFEPKLRSGLLIHPF